MAALATDKLSASSKQLIHRHQTSIQKAKAADAQVSAFITIADADASLSALKDLGVAVNARFGNLITAQIPLARIPEVAELPEVVQVEVATEMEANSDVTRVATDASIAQEGTSYGLPVDYDGSGVVLGIIDSGFEFNHMAFQDANGKTRIKKLYIASQNNGKRVVIDGETLPGSEFEPEDIPQLTTDYRGYGHGNICLDMAAGTRVGQYGGIAPGADLVVCAMGLAYRTDDVAFANAARYILNYAKSVGKPCVITMSVGRLMGPHDGSSALCRAFDAVAADGAVMCMSAGNYGGVNRYLHHRFESGKPQGSAMLTGSDAGITVDTWSRTADKVSVRVQLIDAQTRKIVYATPVLSSDTYITAGPDSLQAEGYNAELTQYVQGYIEIVTSTGVNGRFNIRTNAHLNALDNGKKYVLGVQLYGADGVESDSWLFGDTFAAYPDVDGYHFAEGNDAGMINDNVTGHNTISVGNYVARTSLALPNGTTATADDATLGDIYITSSCGHDANDVAHPFVAAPGTLMVNAGNSYEGFKTIAMVTSAQNTATGRTNYWCYNTGTSLSAPTVAGVVALWLQARPSLTVAQVKDIITSTAFADEFTAASPLAFGAGKINALGGFPDVQFTLEQICSDSRYLAGRSYCIKNGSLQCMRVSADGTRLYAKSVDSLWMAISLPTPLHNLEKRRLVGAWMNGVRGTLLNKQNPQLDASQTPTAAIVGEPVIGNIMPSSYTNMLPAPMQLDTLRYAMWNADAQRLEMPSYAVALGLPAWQGGAVADFSWWEASDGGPQLEHLGTYDFVAISRRNADGTYTACPLEMVREVCTVPVVAGDVNADGLVNTSDITALINYILGTASYPLAACDINADGLVNTTDLAALIALILGA